MASEFKQRRISSLEKAKAFWEEGGFSDSDEKTRINTLVNIQKQLDGMDTAQVWETDHFYHLLYEQEVIAINEMKEGGWKVTSIEEINTCIYRVREKRCLELDLIVPSPSLSENGDVQSPQLPASFASLTDLTDLTLTVPPNPQFLSPSFFPVGKSSMPRLRSISFKVKGFQNTDEERHAIKLKDAIDTSKFTATCRDGNDVQRTDAASSQGDLQTFPQIRSCTIVVNEHRINPSGQMKIEDIDGIDNMVPFILHRFPGIDLLMIECRSERDDMPRATRTVDRLVEVIKNEGTTIDDQGQHHRLLSNLVSLSCCGLTESHLSTLLCDIIVPFKEKIFPNLRVVGFSHNDNIESLEPTASRLTDLLDDTKDKKCYLSLLWLPERKVSHLFQSNVNPLTKEDSALLKIIEKLGILKINNYRIRNGHFQRQLDINNTRELWDEVNDVSLTMVRNMKKNVENDKNKKCRSSSEARLVVLLEKFANLRLTLDKIQIDKFNWIACERVTLEFLKASGYQDRHGTRADYDRVDKTGRDDVIRSNLYAVIRETLPQFVKSQASNSNENTKSLTGNAMHLSESADPLTEKTRKRRRDDS